MEVVGRLVRVDPDVGRLDAVDRAVEALLVDVADRFGERLLEGRVEVVPERAAAADDVLPHPALRLVQRRGDAVAERRALERRRDAVLVEPVPALVHRREDRRDVVLLVARRQADVLRAGAGRERMHGQVEARERLVEAEPLDDLQRVRRAAPRSARGRTGTRRRPRPSRSRRSAARARPSGRRRPGAPRPSSSPARSRRGGRRTARRSPRSSRRSGASARRRARGGGGRARSRSRLARLRPDVVGVRGCAGHLGGQLGRDAARLLPVAARGADQAKRRRSRSRAAARGRRGRRAASRSRPR